MTNWNLSEQKDDQNEATSIIIFIIASRKLRVNNQISFFFTTRGEMARKLIQFEQQPPPGEGKKV